MCLISLAIAICVRLFSPRRHHNSRECCNVSSADSLFREWQQADQTRVREAIDTIPRRASKRFTLGKSDISSNRKNRMLSLRLRFWILPVFATFPQRTVARDWGAVKEIENIYEGSGGGGGVCVRVSLFLVVYLVRCDKKENAALSWRSVLNYFIPFARSVRSIPACDSLFLENECVE